MPYRLYIEKQSISLQINPNTKTIIGQTHILLTIINTFENKESQQAFKKPQKCTKDPLISTKIPKLEKDIIPEQMALHLHA